MTNENHMKLEDLALLNELADVNYGLKSYGEALKSSSIEGMEQVLNPLSKIISKGAVPELLLNATPQAIYHEIDNYKTGNSERFKKAFDDSKGEIINFYSESIDLIKNEINKKVYADERLKDASDEVKDKNVALSMYQNLASMLSEFELSHEYLKKHMKDENGEDKELIETYLAFKDFENAKPEELSRKTAGAITKMNGLSSNARNLINDWTPYSQNIKEMYGRMLAKSLLDDKLKLNKNKFDEVFGTVDNYAQIAKQYLGAIENKKK
jgi:hypothetical protein